MSEIDLSYQSKTVLNLMPSAIDLSKEITYSSYVTKREYVQVYPTTQAPAQYTASNLGTSVRIILADPARWLDKRSATLQMDISVPALSAGDKANMVILDGECAMIAKCNVFLGGGSSYLMALCQI